MVLWKTTNKIINPNNNAPRIKGNPQHTIPEPSCRNRIKTNATMLNEPNVHFKNSLYFFNACFMLVYSKFINDSYFPVIVNSTLRLSCLPSSVSFEATGLLSPNPLNVTLDARILFCKR